MIRAQKRHQTGTAWRRQTDGRWQSLLNRQISASLLSLHQMQWSTRCGAARRGVLDGERSYKVKWPPRPDPRGERADRDSAFCPARGTVLRCLYGVLCYSVYVPIFPRTPLNRAHRHARCGKIVENKLVCPRRPLVPSRGRLPPLSVLLSFSPRL